MSNTGCALYPDSRAIDGFIKDVKEAYQQGIAFFGFFDRGDYQVGRGDFYE